MSLPLSDIRVVEIGQVFAGPFAAMLLADQGAQVIKIEPPQGELGRQLVPSYPGSGGLSLAYLTFNRNKRSIVVDMSKPQGREVVYSLVRLADVLVINMRLGARRRRGVTYEEMANINPKLIYASITGNGEAGPDADLLGNDFVTQARMGDMAGRRLAGSPPPEVTLFNHFDMVAAMLTAYAVVLALREREHTGQGQKVEVSVLESALACQTVQMTRVGSSDDSYGVRAAMTGNYLCSDGRYIYVNIGFPPGGQRWANLCRIVGLEHLAEEPAFDSTEKLIQNADEICAMLSSQFAARPAAEWEALLKAGDLVASVVKEISEVYDDPQVVANEMITEFEQPGLGSIKTTNVPFRMSNAINKPRSWRHAPTLGENTDEVLQELGHTSEDIQELRLQGVVS